MKKSNVVGNYLDELFSNPRCELNYKYDYELLLAIMLSAQSTDKRVNSVTDKLFKKYNSLDKLRTISVEKLEQIIRPIGSFHKKSLYFKDIVEELITKYNYKVPAEREKLVKLNGIGRKTANVFLSEFYKYPAIAVDTHVERVSKRLKIVDMDADVKEIEKALMKFYPKKDWAKRHLQMVLFGRYKCKSRNPECINCKLEKYCIKKSKP